MGKPEEIASAIYFLADNEQSAFMTGQALDCGWWCHGQAEHGMIL